MRLFIILLLLSFLTACATGDNSIPSCCLIAQPSVTLTGEKTSIERHIVGEYSELEKDAWIISSVDTGMQRGERASVESGDEELLAAIKIREFHKEKIRNYKDEGVIGELNNGLVAYRQLFKYENNSNFKKILLTVIEEENKARRTIFIRSLMRNKKDSPSEEEMRAFGKIFAEEQQALAEKNDWIQDRSGQWIRKK
ncbi:MAG: DUF1318 domain-containing protein [Spirochaetes bacterium]|nr:DUF1318 domain-containing protein [Spirochaetota bacterium]